MKSPSKEDQKNWRIIFAIGFGEPRLDFCLSLDEAELSSLEDSLPLSVSKGCTAACIFSSGRWSSKAIDSEVLAGICKSSNPINSVVLAQTLIPFLTCISSQCIPPMPLLFRLVSSQEKTSRFSWEIVSYDL